jgi:hypothetical protein
MAAAVAVSLVPPKQAVDLSCDVLSKYGGHMLVALRHQALRPVGLENSVRWFELRLRLKRCSNQQLFLSVFK